MPLNYDQVSFYEQINALKSEIVALKDRLARLELLLTPPIVPDYRFPVSIPNPPWTRPEGPYCDERTC